VFDFIAIIIKGGPVMVPRTCSIVSLPSSSSGLSSGAKPGPEGPVEELLQLVDRREFGQSNELGRKSIYLPHGFWTAGLIHRNPSLPKAWK